jgi:hypothetical protein
MKFKMAATAGLSLTWEKCFKTLLLWYHLDNWNQTAQEWSLEVPLQSFCFFMPIGNPRWLPPQIIVLTQDHMRKIQKYILLWSYCTDWT